ncbi:MAG: PHP domain-containing protein [Chroococcidiopsidaceae cyanobacterium CP_BM_ER_R8_30]|nr:PHP domain-containing protein [Chroococcidiopsidaceae cyanobacterium CP_BM_ER_R8_30]
MVVNFARTSASSQRLKQVFQTLNAESCPLSFNFHMHTVYSDGRFQPETLMQQAIALGLQGLAITDHHTLCGYQVAQRWLENWKLSCKGRADGGAKSGTLSREGLQGNAPELWSGMEVNAALLGIEVHILGYAFDPEHPSLAPYTQRHAASGNDYHAAKVIAAIHQAGGLAVLAHPARYKRSHFELIPAAAQVGIDGVEAYYAYNNPNPWQPSPVETRQVKQLAATYGLLNTCGTDTHGLSLLQRL